MFCQVTLGQSGGHIKPTWVLIDNQYTMDMFSNKRLLKNIRKSDRLLATFQREDGQLLTSKGTCRGMVQYVSIQRASPTSRPFQRWHINTKCPATAPEKTSSLSTCQGGGSDHSHNAKGVSSTSTRPQVKRCLSIL